MPVCGSVQQTVQKREYAVRVFAVCVSCQYAVRVFAVCVRCSRVHFLGRTALMQAAGKGYKETVKVLLAEGGINVNQTDDAGMNSGHFLVSCQYVDRCSKRLR